MPNTVVKLTNAESTWLEAAREDRKLLIKEKLNRKVGLFTLSSFGSGFKVEVAASPPFLEDGILVSQPSPLGEGLYGSGFAAFFIGRCPKVVFKSRVTSHNNDMSSPLEKGRAKGAGWIHVAV